MDEGIINPDDDDIRAFLSTEDVDRLEIHVTYDEDNATVVRVDMFLTSERASYQITSNREFQGTNGILEAASISLQQLTSILSSRWEWILSRPDEDDEQVVILEYRRLPTRYEEAGQLVCPECGQ